MVLRQGRRCTFFSARLEVPGSTEPSAFLSPAAFMTNTCALAFEAVDAARHWNCLNRRSCA